MEYTDYEVDAGQDAVLGDAPASAEHESWMRLALEQARAAARMGEVPIGAVVVDAAGQVIGAGHNMRERLQDPSAHAEVVALRQAAARVGSWRLSGCTLVVTVEPCLMCAGAVLMAHVPTVVFGAWECKTGAVGSQYDVLRDGRLSGAAHVYAGVLRSECAQVMKNFFVSRRGFREGG